jgi:ABC-2 type transport system permease protein
VIWTIAQRELRNLFISPLAWVVLGIAQVIFGLVFMAQIASYSSDSGTPGITVAVALPLFGWASILLLFVIPLLTMRLVAEERRSHTLTLLFSAPVSMTEIVLGKYLGVIFYLLILTGLILVMPLSLLLGGSLDPGLLMTAVFGLVLLLSSFTAIGLFMSTLTRSPTLAAMGSFGALLLLWMFALSADMFGDNVLSYLSIINHYVPFLEGIINTRDIIYYLTIAVCFLVFSIRRLNMDRLGA